MPPSLPFSQAFLLASWISGTSRPRRLSSRAFAGEALTAMYRRVSSVVESIPGFILATISKELLAVPHLESSLDAKPLAVGISLQDQERRIRRDDVILFREGDDLVFNGLGTTLLQQGIEVHASPESRNERIACIGALASASCRGKGEADVGRKSHRLAALRAANDYLAGLCWASLFWVLRRITAENNLLRARCQVWQWIGINPAVRRPRNSTFKLRRAGCVISPSNSIATAVGPCDPLTCRNDPPPIAAIALSTPGSKLLLTATAWNVPHSPHSACGTSADAASCGAGDIRCSTILRSRFVKATGSASPVVTMPSPI